MKVDGRLCLHSIKQKVRERNKKYQENFPHKVADEFAIYRGKIGSLLYNRTKL